MLISDQDMPGMRRPNLARAVRAVHQKKPCILCTASVEGLDETASAGINEGIRNLIEIYALITAASHAVRGGSYTALHTNIGRRVKYTANTSESRSEGW